MSRDLNLVISGGGLRVQLTTHSLLLTTVSFPVRLPQLEPWIARHLLVVYLIYESKLAGSRRTRIRQREHSLQRFDIRDDPFGIHAVLPLEYWMHSTTEGKNV